MINTFPRPTAAQADAFLPWAAEVYGFRFVRKTPDSAIRAYRWMLRRVGVDPSFAAEVTVRDAVYFRDFDAMSPASKIRVTLHAICHILQFRKFRGMGPRYLLSAKFRADREIGAYCCNIATRYMFGQNQNHDHYVDLLKHYRVPASKLSSARAAFDTTYIRLVGGWLSGPQRVWARFLEAQ
jgi:hypothetical protein